MSDKLSIVTLPGDGIGIEVMAEGRKILETVLRSLGVQHTIEEYPCGGLYFTGLSKVTSTSTFSPAA